MPLYKYIRSYWRSTIRGISNLIRYLPSVWNDTPWDWEGFIPILETKLTVLADNVENGYTASRDRDVRRMRICAALCRRIREDNYIYQRRYFGDSRGRYLVNDDPISAPYRDFKYLLRLLKHFPEWWD